MKTVKKKPTKVKSATPNLDAIEKALEGEVLRDLSADEAKAMIGKTDPVRTREQLLAWWMRTMNEVHWMSDALMFERSPFKASLTPLLCNELGILLDQVWHKMAVCMPLTPPFEFCE